MVEPPIPQYIGYLEVLQIDQKADEKETILEQETCSGEMEQLLDNHYEKRLGPLWEG